MSPQPEDIRHIDKAKGHMGEAREALKAGAAEALESGSAAAAEARAELDAKLQGLLDQGKGLMSQAEAMRSMWGRGRVTQRRPRSAPRSSVGAGSGRADSGRRVRMAMTSSRRLTSAPPGAPKKSMSRSR